MGVKLDWQIESDREQQRATEDPTARYKRRQQQAALLFFTLLVIAFVGGLGGAIALRLYTVDNKLKQDLSDVARTEVSTLRIGDAPGFMALMRSASASWIKDQRARFSRYQELKTQGALQLTDNIHDVTVDGPRGRVLVEEDVKGVHFNALWFFWHYADGWRHVPSDLTFWGDPQQIAGNVTAVKYDALDSTFAHALASRVDTWWTQGCALIGCANPPPLIVEIVPDPGLAAQWAAPNTLRIASPLAAGDRAPDDPPLAADLETTIATRISEKLFDLASGQLPINANSDAAWLHQNIIDWLAATLTGHGSSARIGFVQSIADHYGGASAVAAILKQLSTNSDISVVAVALNQPLESLTVDWKSFFEWRFELEKNLIATGDQRDFLTLWDASANTQAMQHWRSPYPALPQVQSVTLARDASGTVATLSVLNGIQTFSAQFRVVGGTWKRIA